MVFGSLIQNSRENKRHYLIEVMRSPDPIYCQVHWYQAVRLNRIFILCVAILIVPLLPPVAHSQTTSITGTVSKVRDGDTLEVGPVAIRLMGVTAPELGELLGLASRDFMERLVLAKQIRCEMNGDKSYDRFVALCFLNGKDVGETLIRAGLALDCPRFSEGRYSSFERRKAKNEIRMPKYCRR